MNRLPRLRVFLVLLSLASCNSDAFAVDDLEKRLLAEAPKWLTHLQDQGIKNVGALKFRVKKGDAPASDSVGELNYRLSEKLERALIVRNPVRNPIGIIRDANRVAAMIPGATHLNASGRAKLFSMTYPLAWGTEKVTPDAFLTGTAVISPDLKSMTVLVAYFTKSGSDLEKLGTLNVPLDIEDLLESGESFTLRALFDDGPNQASSEVRKEKASEAARLVSTQVKSETLGRSNPSASTLHPLAPGNTQSPVSLEIRYDGIPQKFEFRDGAAFVAEPRASQKISFVVRRKGGARPRLGVVLKVNGENTLYRQTSSDAQCSPWIFESRLSEFGVNGYQIDQNKLESFKVLSQSESSAQEINYGSFAGSISISVFPEQSIAIPAVVADTSDEGEDFALMTRGVFPDRPAANLSALRNQLAQSGNRGLITQGVIVDQNIEVASFKSDELPIMSASIRYYKPQR